MSIAVVQSVSAQSSNSSALTTGAITTTAGNLIILDGIWYGSTFTSFTDSKSNSWTTWPPGVIANTLRAKANENYNGNLTSAGAGHTFTFNISAPSYIVIAATEVSGQDTTTPLDKTATKVNDTGHNTTHTCTATATTSQANQLWHGFGGDDVQFAFHAFSISAPWGGGQNRSDSAIGGQGIITGDQVVSATGTAAFVFADTGTLDDNFLMGTSTWNAAGGGGGGSVFAPYYYNQHIARAA